MHDEEPSIDSSFNLYNSFPVKSYKGSGAMLEHLKQMLEVIVTDDELFRMIAQGMRKLHQALIAEGFTEEQATKIVASQGMNWLQGG